MYVDYKCLLYRVRVFFYDFTISCKIYYYLYYWMFIVDVYLVALVTCKRMDLLQMLLI